MSFLPEADREYLEIKGYSYEEAEEKMPNGEMRRAVIIARFPVPANLRAAAGSVPDTEPGCELLIIIPNGYDTTKLDSFYTRPRLRKNDGRDPHLAQGEADLFSRKWQFWSRHLSPDQWRVGVDGLDSYLDFVRHELRKA